MTAKMLIIYILQRYVVLTAKQLSYCLLQIMISDDLLICVRTYKKK